MALYEAALVNALAQHVIPKLPDVTQIPEATWVGWEPIFTELHVDRSNEQQVKETIERCQTMLGSLLQAALMSGQQQAQSTELAAVAPLNAQVGQGTDVMQQQAVMPPAAVPVTQGTEGQVTASQLQLTQLVGSAGDQQVLLNQPKASIIARARMPRGERLEIWYQLAFEGFSESEAEWFPAHRIRAEYPQGAELIENFEAGLEQSGQQDAQLPASVAPDGGTAQLPAMMPAAAPDGSAAALAADAGGMQQLVAGLATAGDVAVQQPGDAAVGQKRSREEGEADDDPSKRQRADEATAAAAAAGGVVDPTAAAVAAGLDPHAAAAAGLDPDAAAAAAAEAVATSAGMAAQLGGGQLFAMAGADGQPMLQVVPLQVPDAANLGQLGQLGQLDMSQLTQLGLDPQALQALTLQGMQVGNMQQLVLHMPAGAAAGQPMLATGLQLTMPGALQMPGGHHPGREHVVAHIKEAIKLLMHSSEELQRKRRQQMRRNELNQRRALLLPDGSAAPGALPTTAAGTPAPPPVRPTNMLQAIQALPPAEKRAMLISALRRAIPVMMQTCQVGFDQYQHMLEGDDDSFGMTHRIVGKDNIVNSAFFESLKQAIPSLMSQQAEYEAAGLADGDAMMQYQQLLAAQGQGMQLIAVPLQGGMQTLMQMPLSAEQIQQMGSAVTLDANGQLQLPPGMALPQVALDPTTLAASMAMLTPEQLQQMGLQAGDSALTAALDPAALQAAAAAGLAMPGQDLSQAGVPADPAAAAAAMMAAQDPAALAAAAAAAGAQQMAYDPATAAALAAAAGASVDASGAAQQAAADPAAAAQEGELQTVGMPDAAAGTADAAAAATGVAPTDGAAVAPAADDGTGDVAAAGGGAPAKPREEEAILAAISLTNLSRMPGPGEEAEDAAAGDAAAAAAAPADAAAAAAATSAAAADPTTAAVMEAAAPVPITPAGPEHMVGDAAVAAAMAAAAGVMPAAPDVSAAMAAFMPDAATLAAFQQQQLQLQLPQQIPGMEGQYVQLPAHLAGMQHLLDQNQSLLDPTLATQDFTAAAHAAAAADGAAPV